MDSKFPYQIVDEAVSKLRFLFSNNLLYERLSTEDLTLVYSCMNLLSLVVEHGNI